jgi:peptidoglycan/LPS O-acetylase OafA/YrhL
MAAELPSRGPAVANDHIEGIDYLRAIMSVLVVVWHMGGAGRSLIFSSEKYLEHVFTLSDLINFHVLLQAVPTFIFISSFLYVARGATTARLKKHLKRLLILLTFWAVAFNIFRDGYAGLLHSFPHSPGAFALAVLTAGHTLYYFFFSLLACQVLAHLITRLDRRMQILGLALSTAMLACLPALTKISGCFVLGAYWNPLNFIPYPFAAVLIAQNRGYIRAKKNMLISISLVVFVMLSIIEWRYSIGAIFFPGQGYAFPTYTRASLLFSVVALGIVALESRIKSIGIIRYMAKYSLALYCLHPFLMDPVKAFVVGRFSGNSAMATYAAIIIVVALSYIIAPVLRIYLKEEVIT